MKNSHDNQTQDLLKTSDRNARWRQRQWDAGRKSRTIWATDDEIKLVREYLEQLRKENGTTDATDS